MNSVPRLTSIPAESDLGPDWLSPGPAQPYILLLLEPEPTFCCQLLSSLPAFRCQLQSPVLTFSCQLEAGRLLCTNTRTRNVRPCPPGNQECLERKANIFPSLNLADVAGAVLQTMMLFIHLQTNS